MGEGCALKIRVKFTKRDSMSYIGHLDVMRYFQKVIRRAGIPIAFSSGFSPHMIMSFASPLGLGVTSKGEYFDIEITEEIPSKEAVARMNATSVEGIEVLSFRRIPSEKKSSGMTILAGASYLVTFKETVCGVFREESIGDVIDSFLEQSQINILKETKRSKKIVDIKPFIYELKVKKKYIRCGEDINKQEDVDKQEGGEKQEDVDKQEGREKQEDVDKQEGKEKQEDIDKQKNIDEEEVLEKREDVRNKRNIELELTLAAGSKENLKPNLVMEALCMAVGVEYRECSYQYHRLEMFANVGGEEDISLVSLESLGEEIL